MLTVTLRSGLVVLAKLYKGEPSALTYANRTQAYAAAEKVGGTVHGRHPFYVCPPTVIEKPDDRADEATPCYRGEDLHCACVFDGMPCCDCGLVYGHWGGAPNDSAQDGER